MEFWLVVTCNSEFRQLNGANMKTRITAPAIGLMALVFLAGATSTVMGAALQGQIALRPLTPQDIKDYSLTGLQRASGLSTVGLGQPAHLEALINSAVAPSNIVSVTWVLTSKPVGSVAALESSPLGTNVPTYRIIDRSSTQVAGRTLLRPDVVGQYTVAVSIVTTDSGTTNLTQKITASTYLGAITCALCHSGGAIASNTYSTWVQTPHAVAFSNAIDGWSTDHFSQNCISCHVVGYDTQTNAVNGGFDDIARSTGWAFPAQPTNGNFAAMPAALRRVSNVQCENCHGAGSEHAYTALVDTNLAKQAISVSLGAGSCSQCHDSLTHHYRSAEWGNSRHASMGSHTSSSCGRCHTAQGFVNYVQGAPAVTTPYETITCGACHDPHKDSNPHQLRTLAAVTLMDNKTTITNGGAGLICMNCHMSRRDATNYVETTAGSSGFGPHHGPQSDMLVGANAITYGAVIPSSAHREVVEDSCATCHMQEAETSPAFTHAGGHTFNMKWDSGSNTVELVEACVQCHGEIEGDRIMTATASSKAFRPKSQAC
jgi:hypothetical protein